MVCYSKFKDVNAVINKAKELMDKIEKEYKSSLASQSVSSALFVDVKDYLGNLRSSLDYLINKVSKCNFPICKSEKDFDNRTTDLSEDLKKIVKKWQPFQGNRWMEDFNILNNKSKHITLIPQKRRESVETRVTHPMGGGVSWSQGVTFGGGVSVMGVPIDPRTQMPVPNNIVKTEKITWVSFEFDNTEFPGLSNNIHVVSFLKKCFENVTKVISEMEVVIDD